MIIFLKIIGVIIAWEIFKFIFDIFLDSDRKSIDRVINKHFKEE